MINFRVLQLSAQYIKRKEVYEVSNSMCISIDNTNVGRYALLGHFISKS